MPGSAPLRFKMAISTQGHTVALKDGSIPIDGVQPEFVNVDPQIAAYRRMVRDVEFDVCDIAPSTYMIAREHGAPFKALPLFVSRNFHHSGRPDSRAMQVSAAPARPRKDGPPHPRKAAIPTTSSSSRIRGRSKPNGTSGPGSIPSTGPSSSRTRC